MIRKIKLTTGDEGVILHADGTIDLIHPFQGQQYRLTERHQALVGAALQCENDLAFRADAAAKFRLYLAQPAGEA